ncbi:pleckstrin homology domain-containing family A member 5-like isoform X2 [Oscarella lobularis]|uniref:pleckstrin homology domain-containing family A member 5-like isoform X2 n=1 Tax=Oscarella lobularis TaxID=121494 RepID=UPI0033141CCB
MERRTRADLATDLPDGWTINVTQDGRVFFINDDEQTTTWLDPRTGVPVNASTAKIEGLPRGWEEALTAEGVSYFIDHKTRRTTFNCPLTGKPKLPEALGAEYTSTTKSTPSPRRYSKRPSISDIDLPLLKKTPTSRQLGVLKRDAQAEVAMRGWLFKQGSTAPKAWKKRWFVLSDYCLFYYKGSAEDSVLGNVILPGYKIEPVAKEDKIRRRFAFKATHAGMRTYFFAAESKEVMIKWINLMTLASLMMGRIGNEDKKSDSVPSDDKSDTEVSRPHREEDDNKPKSNGVTRLSEERLSSSDSKIDLQRGDDGNKSGGDEESGMRRVTSKVKLVHSESAEIISSPKMDPVSETTSAEELTAIVRRLQAENRALRKDRNHYQQLVESSKGSLIKLRDNMFQTLTSLQHELYESQETCEELRQRNEELEADVLRSKTMVSMSDQMVLLGRAVADENEALIKQLSKASELLAGASEKARAGPSQRLLEFSAKLAEEKTLQDQALQLKDFLKSEEDILEAKLTDLGSLEDQMEDSSDLVSKLQEEKAILEKKLAGLQEEKTKEDERSEKEGRDPGELEKQLAVISERLTNEETELEQKAQENTRLEQEVGRLKERLERAEQHMTAVGETSEDREKLEGEIADVKKEINDLLAQKVALKKDVDDLRVSVLSNELERKQSTSSGSSSGGAPSSEDTASFNASHETKRQMSEMTRLEMSLELAAAKSQLEAVEKEKEQMATLKVKLEREHTLRLRSSSDSNAYRAPKWVKDLEVKKAKTADMSPKVRIRDPEKLSFKEKLQLFL